MRIMLVAFGLMVAALASPVSAQEVTFGPTTYRTVQEADAHRPPMPPDCRSPNGAMLCVPMFIAEDGWDDNGDNLLVWRPAWAPAAQTRCVDELTAEREMSCDARGAVRILALFGGVSGEMPPPPRVVMQPPRR